MTDSKHYGLLLTLGGAAMVNHTVKHALIDNGKQDFHPKTPRPLEDCGISYEDARKLDADPGCPLKLVKLPGAPTHHTAVETAKDND